jgi:hypothetical protein
MRMTRATRQVWIVRVAVGVMSLAGVVYAAEQAAPPESSGDLTQTIKTQKVNEGSLVPTAAPDEHQAEAFTPDQMLVLAARYEQEMKAGLEHAEMARIVAYRSRDIIRMTCIDDKLAQMKTVFTIAAPRLSSIRSQTDGLAIRQQFMLIQQAQQRLAELLQEIEACTGDNLKSVSIGRLAGEAEPASDNIYDPTRPPSPAHDIERPGEASPYR